MKKYTIKKVLYFLSLTIAVVFLWSSCKKDNPSAWEKTTQTGGSSAPITTHPAKNNAYVTQLFEFNPAPGQFINTSLGDTLAAKGTLSGTNGLVSLGAYGGFIIVGFDHTVLNVAGKADIIVYGNAFPGFAEPGVIWVMQDTNGNGKPDDTWYELSGSETGKAGYITNYSVTYTRPRCDTCSVTWRDNLGKNGVVQTNPYHTQPYFPMGIKGDSYTLAGTLLPSANVDLSDPLFIISNPFAFGYSDSTEGGDMVDIANATDRNGNKVNLKGIDFIKVQTGIQINMGSLGELSTEFCGAADISLLKN